MPKSCPHVMTLYPALECGFRGARFELSPVVVSAGNVPLPDCTRSMNYQHVVQSRVGIGVGWDSRRGMERPTRRTDFGNRTAPMTQGTTIAEFRATGNKGRRLSVFEQEASLFPVALSMIHHPSPL